MEIKRVVTGYLSEDKQKLTLGAFLATGEKADIEFSMSTAMAARNALDSLIRQARDPLSAAA